MKYTLQITVFTLLQPVALSGILRGQTKIDDRRLPSQSGGGGNSGNNMYGGCPPPISKGTLQEFGFTECSSSSDCTSACTSADCCCVNGGGGLQMWCGVPLECNNFVMCVGPAPTQSPTEEDRGIGGPGGVIGGITVDANGCIAVSQEWCPILNECVVVDTNPCSATPVDADGCVSGTQPGTTCHPDGCEIYCESRQDCILDELWSCPMENPVALCPGKELVPVSVTDQNGDFYSPRNGQVNYYPDADVTQVRARVVEGFDGPLKGEIDFTLLNNEYQLYTGSGCATMHNVVVYFVDSLRHPFYVCWEEMEVGGQGLQNVPAPFNQYDIPRCNPGNPSQDTGSVTEWFRVVLAVYGPDN